MNDNDCLEPGKTTICIVNYKTEKLTRLCLRSIRKFTSYPYEVIVVDNNSGDESLDYLRQVSWIKLIERPGEQFESGGVAHGTALDLGLKACKTEFFMSMHSDTFVHRENWLTDLMSYMNKTPNCACVGGGKLDLKPKWQVLLKKCTDVKEWLRRLKNEKRNDFYIRTICAIYRMSALKKENLYFTLKMDEGVTCGKQLYYELIDKGYSTCALPEYKMAEYIHHLAHATMVLNPEFQVRKRTEQKCRKALDSLLNSKLAQEILNDTSLDS